MKKWSRRQFLEAGAIGSVAMISGTAVPLPAMQQQGGTQEQKSATGALDARERGLLHAAMDEIIPAGDGIPAASEVGGLDYLGQLAGRDAKVAKELRDSLNALDGLTQSRLKASFSSLTHEQRVELLTALEKQDERTFRVLRNYVYEAYYTQPAVWKRIGYEFYPTNGPGPRVKEVFDEAVLTEVRKKSKGYVEVG